MAASLTACSASPLIRARKAPVLVLPGLHRQRVSFLNGFPPFDRIRITSS
ncbi:cytochrome C oxidase assembly protein [Nitrobacter sp. Nb-311A]|nr:cytochrome C oxidase assembly protein [Nitrobacter sp. Nb-311A]